MKIKPISILTAIITGIALTFSAAAAQADISESAGFAVESERAFSVLAPYDKNYVQISWNTSERENCGVPIVDGESVLLPSGHTITRLSEKNGEVLGTAELTEKVSENCKGAIIGKMIVQPARTSIFTVDSETMSVKNSRKFGEIVTDVGVLDNHVYFGVKTDSAYKFICAELDSLDTAWEYDSEKPVTSPALLNGQVIFGAGKNLVSATESARVENPVGAEITHVFAGKYAVFMSCADGNLRKLRLAEDGKTEPDSLMECKLGGELSAPAEYENRVYVGSSEGFFVLDGLNMEVAKEFPEMKNSSAPVICYGGGQRAYTAAPHADPNGNRWYLYAVLDNDDGISAGEIAKIIDFTDGKTAVSERGVMYFRDASGQLWAIAVSETNVLMIIIKIVLTLAIIVMALIIIRAWVKRHTAKQPPQY